VLFYQQTLARIEKTEAAATKVQISSIYEKVDEAQRLADTAALIASKNGALLNAFAKYDREATKVVIDNLWADLKPIGFAQLNLHYKPENEWKFFYRGQAPERFNDSAENRPTIMKANSTKVMVSGLEQGRTGYGFRAVTPLFAGSKHIGSLETGFELGKALLEDFQKLYPGNWAIYNLARGAGSPDDRSLIEAIGEEKDKYFKNLMPEENIIKNAKAGIPVSEYDEAQNAKIIYIPIKNFQGDFVALIKYAGNTAYFDTLSEVKQNAIVVCAIGFVFSSIIIFILFRLITQPVKSLIAETERIKNFELDGTANISAKLDEMQELVNAMNSMKTGLRSFKKYIPAELVQQLIRNGQEIDASGERRRLTILFSDIADFSTISEKLTPNELSTQLSEYLSEMTSIILKHGGTVDKYIGDSIMAFWGAPNEVSDHANRACIAAIECNNRLKELAKKWESEGRPVLHTRIGLNTGDVIVGNIGSKQRLSYTAIGDPVNLASRLESLNKEYNTAIIISQSVLSELPNEYVYRLLDIVVVKGKTEPVPIYELISTKGDVTSLDSEFFELFGKAVQSYLEKDWDKALYRFEKLLTIRDTDRACNIFIERCKAFKLNPPSHDWEGEYVYLHK